MNSNSTPSTMTLLGCGTSTGVPLIHCNCAVCTSSDLKNNRLRCSAWIQAEGKSVLIDTSTDFRQQSLRAEIPRIDAVVYTHPHADHIHGIDELRSYNYIQKQSIPVYGNEWTCTDLKKRFDYIFNPPKNIEGGGIPLLVLNPFETKTPVIDVAGLSLQPVSLAHGSKESVGYRLKSVAYVTDCSYIPPESLERLKGLAVLFLDCIRIQPHGTHFNLDQALKTVEELRPKKTYLTHLGHDFDYAEWNKKLPPGVELGYDGLTVPIE